MVPTSVGPAGKPLGFGRRVLFEKMGVSCKELRSLIIVEVGGVCIPRPDLAQEELDRLETVQEIWTGLRLKHLEACSRRGTDPSRGPAGVGATGRGDRRSRADGTVRGRYTSPESQARSTQCKPESLRSITLVRLAIRRCGKALSMPRP